MAAASLQEAILAGDLHALQMLIDSGMDVNHSGGGEPPIFAAVDSENVAAIKMLAAAGADLNFINLRAVRCINPFLPCPHCKLCW